VADEDFLGEDEDVGGADSSAGPKKRIGFIPGIVIQILKWAGVVLGAIIFIVTVVVITLRIMGPGTDPQTRVPRTEAYEARVPILEWHNVMGETAESIRGSTADNPRRTFLVRPYIGYEPERQAVLTELIARNIQIREIINVYFSSRTADQLEGVDNRERVKRELRAEINRILSEGQIREIAFDEYQIVSF